MDKKTTERRERILGVNQLVSDFEISAYDKKLSKKAQVEALSKLASAFGFKLIPMIERGDRPAQVTLKTAIAVGESQKSSDQPEQKKVRKSWKKAFAETKESKSLRAAQSEASKAVKVLYEKLAGEHKAATQDQLNEMVAKTPERAALNKANAELEKARVRFRDAYKAAPTTDQIETSKGATQE